MPKLFIGNIPHASSDAELQEWVEGQGFHVESAQIIRDRSTGQSRGFGFVVLNEEWKMKDAINALNGQRMGGRVLKIFHREGDRLKEGEPIVELDAAELPAQSNLAQAKTGPGEARRQWQLLVQQLLEFFFRFFVLVLGQ